MVEYIEREALMSKLDEKVKFYISDRTLQGNFAAGVLCDVRDETIAKFPSADVAPVRHEKWEVIVGSDGKERMVCTGCRKQQDLTGVFSYCPNCGAKMDGGTQNEQS